MQENEMRDERERNGLNTFSSLNFNFKMDKLTNFKLESIHPLRRLI